MQTYIQNGDLMRSPEMAFLLPDKMMNANYPAVWCLEYRDDSWGYFSEVYTPEDSKYKPWAYRDAKQFCPVWFKNLKYQFGDQLKAMKTI